MFQLSVYANEEHHCWFMASLDLGRGSFTPFNYECVLDKSFAIS